MDNLTFLVLAQKVACLTHKREKGIISFDDIS